MRPTSWIDPTRPRSPVHARIGTRFSRFDLGVSRGRRRPSLRGRLLGYAGWARSGVVGAVGARVPAGASSSAGRCPGRHPPGGDQERRVADHRVARADGEPLDVPVAHQRLPGLGLGEAAVQPHGLDEARQLRRGGDVRADDAAGPQRAGRGVEALPRARACRGSPGRRARPRRAAPRPGRRA